VTVSVAAIDLGASSGRVIVGDVGADRLVLRAAARFANQPVRTPEGLHWDASELFRQAVEGLRTAVDSSPGGLASVAVDSWAVDYGLLRSGQLVAEPFHYRDPRNVRGVERVHMVVPPGDLHRRNGLQFLPFNTVYQLAADAQLGRADRVLLIPDLIGFWLTGRMVTERTNASTTGLLDASTGEWDTELMGQLGLPESLFAELVDPGATIGAVRAEIGLPSLAVTAVGSHDTASAVVGVPMVGDDAAYISCGTWGLVGLELDAPVITEEARAANFTNERGVDGRTRFLTNVMGTWLISETLREWERGGGPVSLGEALRAAEDFAGEVTIFDVQDPRFVPPGTEISGMPARIAELFAERGLRAPEGRAALMRSIVESIAQAFADSLADAERLAGRRTGIVHVVGGGSLNRLLCQATADRSGHAVLAGPVEATAIGNVLIQARTVGAISGSLEDLRGLIARTQDLARFEPRA
jgi:rhamnulokinase